MHTTTFEHKYQIGDKVYTINYKCQVKEGIIKKVSQSLAEEIVYLIDGIYSVFLEKELFATKESAEIICQHEELKALKIKNLFNGILKS